MPPASPVDQHDFADGSSNISNNLLDQDTRDALL
jgi:hypothetical protein